jgi:2-polyprenyl-3-methyl-5-hydroxy-6-metoxy-1,4-benzoquinol methylase
VRNEIVNAGSNLESMVCPVCGASKWRRRFHRQGWDFVRCRCGLTRLDPIPTPAELDAHYASRAVSGNYEAARSSERDATLRQIVELIGPGPGRLFDVGTFDGRLLDFAEAAGWEAWGMDIQGGAIERARERHPGRVVTGSVEEAGELGAFDVISAIGVIEHLRDPDKLLVLAANALPSGGRLILQTPDASSGPARVLRRWWWPIAAPEHVFYFTRRSLRKLCARHHFEVRSIERHWKRLRVGYVYEQLSSFGPEWRWLLRWVPKRWFLPFYGGEMIVLATRD